MNRRDFLKGMAAAGALALLPSLPQPLECAYSDDGGESWTTARVVAAKAIQDVPLFRSSLMLMDNYGISSVQIRRRMAELVGEMDREQAFINAVLAEAGPGAYAPAQDHVWFTSEAGHAYFSRDGALSFIDLGKVAGWS